MNAINVVEARRALNREVAQKRNLISLDNNRLENRIT